MSGARKKKTLSFMPKMFDQSINETKSSDI